MENSQVEELWKQMADMTFAKCKEHCQILGSCCSEGDCGVTESYAASKGVTLTRIENKDIPFLGPDGKCIVAPHLRPLCSLHQCKIAGLGFDPDDPKWTRQYFKLRKKLNSTLGE
jgi:hypothetical protein